MSRNKVAGHWRVGTKLCRTLYVDDKLVGMMDTPELAKRAVDALNGAAAEPEARPNRPAPTSIPSNGRCIDCEHTGSACWCKR